MKKICTLTQVWRNIVYFFLIVTSCAWTNEYDFPDPYPEIYSTTKVVPCDRQGWQLHEGAVRHLFTDYNVRTVVEVGVWKGNWTIFVGNLLPEGGIIFAVDSWRAYPARPDELFMKKIYQQFLSNIIHYKLTKKVIPVRLPSIEAAQNFSKAQRKADLIYIDGAHDYESVLQDIRAWFPLLNEQGVLCGDDWPFVGVASAVKKFADEKRLIVHHSGDFWWFSI